jgi:MFS family permease
MSWLGRRVRRAASETEIRMSDDAAGRGRKAGLSMMVRALGSRNYRLFFTGQGISVIGTWMQQVAMQWLVNELTNSAFWLGFIGFVGRLPTFFLAPLAGVVADRHHRHRLLVITQALAMLQALVVAGLTFAGVIQFWQITVLSIFLGLVNAFDIPVRQSFVVEMVERREDLPNAIALNSFLMNGARLIGPAVAGVIIIEAAHVGRTYVQTVRFFGEASCFLLNGVSYIAVIWALLLMRCPKRAQNRNRKPVYHELREGVEYAFHHPPIRSVLMLLTLISIMGMPYLVLMPRVVSEVLHGGPRVFGFLVSSVGVGALCGAVLMASRRDGRHLANRITVAAVIFGAGLIAFSLARTVPLALGFLVIVGFGMMIQMVSSNTLLQTIVDDDKRGRVMSLYTMSFMGMAPFGSLLAGSVADWAGTPTTLALSGASCILGAGLFATRLRPINAFIRAHLARDAEAIARTGAATAPDAPTTFAGSAMPAAIPPTPPPKDDAAV